VVDLFGEGHGEWIVEQTKIAELRREVNVSPVNKNLSGVAPGLEIGNETKGVVCESLRVREG
jgi:hypothetical protein